MAGYQNISGLSALVEHFDLFMIDQFGVLHDGTAPYDGTIDCLEKLKANGKGVILLSNSGKRAVDNISRLANLGFSRELFDDVVTSGGVAWQGIVDHSFGAPLRAGQ